MSKEINLTPEQLRKLQLIQLDMLTEVDRICKKHNIKYCVIAGTMLGAVRNGKYIPWDDDADIAMLRPEYEKFRRVFAEEADRSKYYFQDHRNTKGYRWGYGKVRRQDTLFTRHGQENMPYKQGIFIDIFPMDSVPDGIISGAVHNVHCFLIRKTLWSAVGRYTDKSIFTRGVYTLLNLIPDKIIWRHYRRFVRECTGKKTRLVRILTFPAPKGTCGYLRKWYENTADIVFEGRTFCGVGDFDAYLSYKFGDYMKLPPKEERKTHPVSKIKLL